MPLEVCKASGSCLLDKLCVQVCVARDKRHVHQRAGSLLHRAVEQPRGIQVIVQDRSLLLVALLHRFQPALLFEPLEDLAADVNPISRRRIEQRFVVGMGLKLEHGGYGGGDLVGDEILADDDDNHARRADILLRSAVDHAVFAHVHRLGEEAGGNVGDKGLALRVGQRVELCAVNGVVFTNIDIIRILGDGEVGAVGDVREGLILRGRNGICLEILFRFGKRALGPVPGNDIIGNAVFHQVERQHRELEVRAAL